MAKKQDTRLEFITLRADGLSYDEIAQKLNISKQTAIEWGAVHKKEIEQLRYKAFLQVKEAFSRSKLKRYETLLAQLEKVDSALLNDEVINRATPKDLMQLKVTLEQQLAKIEQNTTYETQHKEQNILGDDEPILAILSNE